MSLYNIRSYDDVSSNYDEVDYETIYRNFFSADDLFLVFNKYKENFIDDLMDGKNCWDNCLYCNVCGAIDGSKKNTCLGCMLVKRFNPRGKCEAGTEITIKSGNLEGEIFNVNECDFMWDEDEENSKNLIIFMCCIDIFLQNYSNLTFFYVCNNKLIYLTRQFDYGSGSFDILINDMHTSFEDDGVRYLNHEIVKAILHQIEKKLEILELYNFFMRPLSLEDLGFSSKMYDDAYETFSISVHIIPPQESHIVINKKTIGYVGEIGTFQNFLENILCNDIFSRSFSFCQNCDVDSL